MNLKKILDKPLIIIMAKWPRYGDCKTRLSRDIGKENALRIQNKMLHHTFAISNYLNKMDIAEICLAINGIGFNKSQRWCKKLGIQNFYFQGKGCLGEKMRRQILNTQRDLKNNNKNLIFIGTDLPNLCHLDILETISKLNKSDVILGPSNDGGYWLIALSRKILTYYSFTPFINIKWSSDNVLKKTIENLKKQKINISYLNTKIDIDTIHDIDQRS